MAYKINLTGENSKRFIVPEAVYHVKVNKVEIKEGKQSKEKYFEWELSILTGQYKGALLTARTTCIKGKRWLLKQALFACGIKEELDGSFNFEEKDLIGKEIDVRVTRKFKPWVSPTTGKSIEQESNEVVAFLSQEEDNDSPPF